MAPVADQFTDKYWVDYEGAAGKHSILFRFPPGTASASAVTRITAVLNALKAFVHSTTSFNGLRFAAAGSNVSFPMAWTPIVGTHVTSPTANNYPAFISFVGRDSGGVRVRYTVHGVSITPDTDYRLLSGEAPTVQAAITALEATGPSLTTIQGLVPFMNDYANVGYNAYFQRKRRKVA